MTQPFYEDGALPDIGLAPPDIRAEFFLIAASHYIESSKLSRNVAALGGAIIVLASAYEYIENSASVATRLGIVGGALMTSVALVSGVVENARYRMIIRAIQ